MVVDFVRRLQMSWSSSLPVSRTRGELSVTVKANTSGAARKRLSFKLIGQSCPIGGSAARGCALDVTCCGSSNPMARHPPRTTCDLHRWSVREALGAELTCRLYILSPSNNIRFLSREEPPRLDNTRCSRVHTISLTDLSLSRARRPPLIASPPLLTPRRPCHLASSL